MEENKHKHNTRLTQNDSVHMQCWSCAELWERVMPLSFQLRQQKTQLLYLMAQKSVLNTKTL